MGLHILYAEDYPQLRSSMARLLRNNGHRVFEVESGEALLAQLEAGEEYDLVLTDNNMGGKSGLSVLREMRADPRWAAIRVIVMTTDDIGTQVGQLGALYLDKINCSKQILDVLKGIEGRP